MRYPLVRFLVAPMWLLEAARRTSQVGEIDVSKKKLTKAVIEKALPRARQFSSSRLIIPNQVVRWDFREWFARTLNVLGVTDRLCKQYALFPA